VAKLRYRFLITIAVCCILFVGCIENPKHGFVSAKPASKWEESMISAAFFQKDVKKLVQMAIEAVPNNLIFENKSKVM
jgi:hypothetical protein